MTTGIAEQLAGMPLLSWQREVLDELVEDAQRRMLYGDGTNQTHAVQRSFLWGRQLGKTDTADAAIRVLTGHRPTHAWLDEHATRKTIRTMRRAEHKEAAARGHVAKIF